MQLITARTEHAPEICRLLSLCYGQSYTKPELYNPAWVAAMLSEGTLVSSLAVSDGQVVGHYALEIDLPPTLAMTGLALIDPAFRGGGLFHRLRESVEQLAQEIGLEAIYGTAVTAHARSQAAYDRLGNVPTGLYTGMAEGVSFQNLEVTAQSTLSLVHYFKQLRPLQIPPLHCPPIYRPLLQKILETLGFDNPWESLRAAKDGGGFERAEAGLGRPRCLWHPGQNGPPTGDWVDFPLAEDGWLESFDRCRAQGYRFAALVPLTAEGRFRLRLQKPPPHLDWSQMALHHPLSQQIRDFIAKETLSENFP